MRTARSPQMGLPASPFLLVLGLALLPVSLAFCPSPAAAETLELDLPGEDMSDPLWIETLPWAVTGNSCPYDNDYDSMCPYGNWAPDVVYAFAPAWDMVVTVDLCSSFYDTAIFVYENDPSHLLTCNDDGCSGPNYPYPYVSIVENVPLTAGNVYYFVVKGYCAECGVYLMSLAVEPPCPIAFPPGGVAEGEPDCHDGYVDLYNGGCDAATPMFQELDWGAEPLVLCGTSGTYTTEFVPQRDTDWFAVTLAGRSEVTLSLGAEFEAKLHLFGAAGGCDDPLLIEGTSSGACDAAIMLDVLEAGEYWLRVSPAPEVQVPCGARYMLRLEVESDPSAVGPEAGAGTDGARDAIRLAVSPQPAPGAAEILLSLDWPAAVEVSLFDPAGRRLRTLLASGEPLVGRLALSWDGRDEQGRALPSGVYSCRAATADAVATRPMLLLR